MRAEGGGKESGRERKRVKKRGEKVKEGRSGCGELQKGVQSGGLTKENTAMAKVLNRRKSR